MSLGPYASAALSLWGRGWRGVLPIPPGAKHPPPEGWTGASAPMPGYGDVYAWLEERGAWNVALRLPEGVVGLDVDAYGGKAGGATLEALEERWGPLPPTWRITSRDDGVSGIRLYRVDDGLRWPGELGPGLEIIQRRHRYAMAPPSVHPEGRRYAWLDPDLIPDEAPHVESLIWLPAGWVQGATSGELAVDLARVHVGQAAYAEWLDNLPVGDACRAVSSALARLRLALVGGQTSRHDATLRAVMHLARLGGEHHTGTRAALEEARDLWCSAVTADGSRSESVALAEYGRMLTGAAAVVLAVSPERGVAVDPCVDPFADIRGGIPSGASGTGTMATLDAMATSAKVTTVPAPPDSGHALVARDAQATSDAQQDRGVSGLSDLDAARQALLTQELERLRARRGADLALKAEEHARTWRMPPSWDLPTLLQAPDEPVPFVVDQLIPEGSNVLITAQFKAGKTTTILNLTKGLADGKPFLGAFACTPGPGSVAIWNYEVGGPMFSAWLRDLRIEHPERVVGTNLRGHITPLGVPQVIDWTVEWLTARRVAHWILDPWGRVISGSDENSNTEVGRLLETLDDIKERAGVKTLILPTHTGRQAQDVGAERARGASRLDDWADVRWILTVKDGIRYFRAHGRDVDVEEGQLSYDAIMRTLTYVPGGREMDDPPRSGTGRRAGSRPHKGNIQNELIQYIGLHPGATTNDLERAMGGRAGVVGDALAGLVSQHRVTRRMGARRSWRHYIPGHPDALGEIAPAGTGS